MAKLMSVTAALKQEEVQLSAQTVLQLMTLASLVEEAEYLSSTGSGEIKCFTRLTDSGLKYGENKSTMSPTKTEIKIDPSKIKEILAECNGAFNAYVSQLK